MSFPVLSTILFAPIVGAAAITSCRQRLARHKKVSAASMGICLCCHRFVLGYNWQTGGMQFVETLTWLPEMGASFYSLGVDGLSAPMILLTALIGFAGVFASWRVDERPKEFFILFLLLVAGVAGTFVARDLFLLRSAMRSWSSRSIS